jgi:probable F420-dependent oxidoreductase
MEFGALMFFTEYAIPATEFAQALEARGFESVWAPEHSHIPTSRKSPWPGGGELPKVYYEAMDPFVSLTAAAIATRTLKVATGVCLVQQRDPIQTAKLVASIDQVSGGRFLFGVGGGWNAEEMADHGTGFRTRFKLMRERIEAMKEIWTKEKAEYHGEMVDFPEMMAWPKPVQKPHPPILVGGAFPHAARRAVRYGDGWAPIAGRGADGDIGAVSPDAVRSGTRSAIGAGHALRRNRGCRPARPLPRQGDRAGRRDAAFGQQRCNFADAGPLGGTDPSRRLSWARSVVPVYRQSIVKETSKTRFIDRRPDL